LATACIKKTEDVLPEQGGVSMKVDGLSWTGQVAAQMIDNETLVVNAINATAAAQETVGIIIEKVTNNGYLQNKRSNGQWISFFAQSPYSLGLGRRRSNRTAINTTGGKTVPSGTFKATTIATSGAKVIITEGKF